MRRAEIQDAVGGWLLRETVNFQPATQSRRDDILQGFDWKLL